MVKKSALVKLKKKCYDVEYTEQHFNNNQRTDKKNEREQKKHTHFSFFRMKNVCQPTKRMRRNFPFSYLKYAKEIN